LDLEGEVDLDLERDGERVGDGDLEVEDDRDRDRVRDLDEENEGVSDNETVRDRDCDNDTVRDRDGDNETVRDRDGDKDTVRDRETEVVDDTVFEDDRDGVPRFEVVTVTVLVDEAPGPGLAAGEALGGGGTGGVEGASDQFMAGTATLPAASTLPSTVAANTPVDGLCSSGTNTFIALSAISCAALHVGLLS
jgi:hypothetical protein